MKKLAVAWHLYSLLVFTVTATLTKRDVYFAPNHTENTNKRKNFYKANSPFAGKGTKAVGSSNLQF